MRSKTESDGSVSRPVSFWLRVGLDDDILEWYRSIPRHKRSGAIRDLLRRGIEEDKRNERMLERILEAIESLPNKCPLAGRGNQVVVTEPNDEDDALPDEVQRNLADLGR